VGCAVDELRSIHGRETCSISGVLDVEKQEDLAVASIARDVVV